MTTGRALASEIQNPDYVGTFGGTSRALFKITKTDRAGEPLRGRFQAVRLRLGCRGDLGIHVKEYDSMSVRFTSNRAFSGFRYSLAPSGYQTVLQVHGRLRRGGKEAGGKLLILDGPDTEASCNTGGFIGWRATRVDAEQSSAPPIDGASLGDRGPQPMGGEARSRPPPAPTSTATSASG